MSEKNLLVISNNFPNHDNSYVGDIFVKEQVKYLRHYFDNVYVISPVAYGMDRMRNIRQHDYQFDNVRVYFPKYINNPLFWNHGRFMWVNLELRAIESLIRRERMDIDLIHAHFTWPSGAVAVELKESMGVPVIITEHTHQTLSAAIRERNRYFIDTWKKSDAIIRVNKKDIPQICGCGIERSKLHPIVNGYDQRKYHPMDAEMARRLLGLSSDYKIILNIGRLYEEKGQKYLISAINEIITERDDFLCYIGGSGPLRHDLERQIVSLGLEKHVKMIGFVPDEQMCLWMNACDFFVLPSLGEGNPTIMFETLGCGKPFVGTKVGGVPEIITSDDYGLLVEPASPGDLAEKIQVALNREWNSGSILRYAERYTWENIAKEIMDVYGKVLE